MSQWKKEKTKARLNEQKIKEDSWWDGPRESSATWKISPYSEDERDFKKGSILPDRRCK